MTTYDTYPSRSAVTVTASDTTILGETRALYIGSAGDVNVKMGDGTTVLFAGAVAGSVLPLRVTQVLSTSTTASSIVALY